MTKPLRGVYFYSKDGVEQPIFEPWWITPTDDGFRLSGQREVGETAVLDIEADYVEQECKTLTVRWDDAQRSLEARYRHDGDSLLWQINDSPLQQLDLPDGALLFPLIRAATGFLLPRLVEGPADIVLPNLRDPADTTHFLTPLLSERHAELLSGRHYRYFGGEYGDTGADYWLNDEGLVERYLWESVQGTWSVELHEDEDPFG